MSEPLILIYEASIQESQFESFLEVSKKLIALTKEEEGAQVYEWFVNDDKSLVHVVERYASSEALLKHIGTFAIHAEEMMRACSLLRIQICGSPTPELKAALAGENVLYLKPIGGFRK